MMYRTSCSLIRSVWNSSNNPSVIGLLRSIGPVRRFRRGLVVLGDLAPRDEGCRVDSVRRRESDQPAVGSIVEPSRKGVEMGSAQDFSIEVEVAPLI